MKMKPFKNSNSDIFYKIIVPFFLVIGLAFGTVYSLKKLTHKENVSVQDIRQSLINTTSMGAYGGSETKLSEEFRENPNVALSPKQVAINIFMLLFAPMPWQVRGTADAIALVSNVLLLFLILLFIKKADFSDVFQKYLLILCGLLVLLLSFMTGNVGLILREKTILLPFLFLFLFRSKHSGEAIKSKGRKTILHTPVPTIQA
jgi:uncharacterized membrane protein YbaN (DUF454 family)